MTRGNTDASLWEQYQVRDPQAFRTGYPRQEDLARRIRKRVSGGRLLEIGFGDGHLLELLQDDYECHGADISAKSLAAIAPTLPKVRFSLLGTDGGFPFDDASLDVFVASEVLEHMTDDQLRTAISEIARVLKPGGYAFVTFPAREDLKANEFYCPTCKQSLHKWGHKQVWTEERIRREFAAFEIISVLERFYMDKSLNLFGKIAGLARLALSRVREVAGMTFVVTLRR